MKAVISLASILACGLSLDAQISATLNRLPGGKDLPGEKDEVRVRNSSAIPLVAFVIVAKREPGSVPEDSEPIVMYSDPLIDPTATPLSANGERVVLSYIFDDHFGRFHRVSKDPIITAGVFADGTTTGDAVLLTRLISRRSNMLLALENAIEALSDAGRRNVPRSQLIEQFRKMADSMTRWYLPQEQQIGRGLYQSVKGKLMNLPEGELGAPFPPSSFVAEEIATLSRQRAALLKSQPSFADAALILQ